MLNQTEQLRTEIENEPDEKLLNYGETKYLEYLLDKYTIKTIGFYFDDAFVEPIELEIEARSHPSSYDVRRGGTYKYDAIKLCIPFFGNKDLLRFSPSKMLLWTPKVSVEGQCICIIIHEFTDNPETYNTRIREKKDNVRIQCGNVNEEIERHNTALESRAKQFFQGRKERIQKKYNFLAGLDIPIRKRDDLPQTFAIPSPPIRKKIKVEKPKVTEVGFEPEPTLNEESYNEILQVIHDMGKMIERTPSAFKYIEEELLRDHILLQLEPRFEGSATGETFNKSGKTDILLRYESSNVFIAECKFWEGPKSLLDALTQLLGYLTWRDSKSALIFFVRRKDFSSVLKKVEVELPNHPNFLRFVNMKEETWLNIRVHINNDVNREVRLAVLLYHLPPDS